MSTVAEFLFWYFTVKLIYLSRPLSYQAAATSHICWCWSQSFLIWLSHCCQSYSCRLQSVIFSMTGGDFSIRLACITCIACISLSTCFLNQLSICAILLTCVPACLMMKCCRVNNLLPEHVLAGLSPGWVDPNVDWLYMRINLPQLRGMWASTRSPPVTRQLSDATVTIWWSCLGSTHATCQRSRAFFLLVGLSHVICFSVNWKQS